MSAKVQLTTAEMRMRLRRAARALLPVVIDLGPGQPRIATYLVAVTGRGRAAQMVLAPLAAQAIPPGGSRATIRSTDPGDPIAVTARVRAAGADEARGALAGATAIDLPPRGRPRARDLRSEPLILVLPGGMDGIDIQVFPVTDLSSEACAVEAALPLPPGRRFDPVELVDDRRVLRRAAAEVVETIPWRTPAGHAHFRSRLVLGASAARGGSRRHDVLAEADRVRRVLELAAMLQAPCEIGEGGQRLPARLLACEEDHLVIAHPPRAQRSDRPVSVYLRVELDLFGVSYAMELRVLERRDSRLVVAQPLLLRRRRRRMEPRVTVPRDRDVRLSFRNTVTGGRVERPLVDLSFHGACFQVDPREDLVWPELPLIGARVHDGGRRVELGPLRVRAVGGPHGLPASCHVELEDVHKAEDQELVELLARLKHPELEVHDGEGYGELLEAYRRTHLLYDYMARQLEPIVLEAQASWRRLHRQGADLARTLVHREDGSLDGMVTAFRVWERAWLVQHFATDAKAGFRWAGELQTACVDHVMLRPDARYLFFFVASGNRGMHAFYERFFELTGTPESIERSSVELWMRPGTCAPLVAPRTASALRRDDPIAVGRAAERCLGPITADALSFAPAHLRLPETQRRFRRIGLERARRARAVRDRRGPVYAIVSEHLSPGLNLTWMLNATWILPVHAERDRDGSALRDALTDAGAAPTGSAHGDRFVLLPAGLATRAAHCLHDLGFERVVAARTYVLNRAGLHRYYQYVAERYGEVGARVARRRKRPRAGG